jgi:hypothetical protein
MGRYSYCTGLCVLTLVIRLRKSHLPSRIAVCFLEGKEGRGNAQVAGLPSRGLDFDPIPVYVGFVAIKVALRHIPLE